MKINLAMQDLKIKLQESTLVFPSQETQRRSFFLSNTDHMLYSTVQTVYFFIANPDFPPEIVAKRLKMAVEKVLVPYDFMAGRLRWNHRSGRLEIDCNAAGAGFVVAASEFSLNAIGDLISPNPGFQRLVIDRLNDLGDDDQPLCVFQVTSFKCGGFAIGMSNNHILLDGLAAKVFRDNLASQAFHNKPCPSIPINDRRLLAARSPPLVKFEHTEFFKPETPTAGPPVYEIIHDLDHKILKLTSADINSLKEKAAARISTATKITTFKVVAALIWRCRALSESDDKDRVSSIIIATDIRSKLNPPLPPEYCGNAVLLAQASAKCEEIEKWPFSKVVEMVSDGLNGMTEEYARSAIDWWEINRGIPYGDCLVTSWLRLGLDQLVFPWGKPICCVPVVNYLDRVCWIFSGDDIDGVNILLQRPPEEMERFQFHFRSFFADTCSSVYH